MAVGGGSGSLMRQLSDLLADLEELAVMKGLTRDGPVLQEVPVELRPVRVGGIRISSARVSGLLTGMEAEGRSAALSLFRPGSSVQVLVILEPGIGRLVGRIHSYTRRYALTHGLLTPGLWTVLSSLSPNEAIGLSEELREAVRSAIAMASDASVSRVLRELEQLLRTRRQR